MNNDITKLIKTKTISSIPMNISKEYLFLIILVTLSLTYYYTYMSFSYYASLLFGLISAGILFRIDPVASVIYLFIYFYLFYYQWKKQKRMMGVIFPKTNMIKKNKPYIASYIPSKTNPFMISKEKLQTPNPQQFSISLFMYVNSRNTFPHKEGYQNTWNNYRFQDWKSVFYRGNNLENETNLQIHRQYQFPGVWLSPKINNISIAFQNGESDQVVERVDIENIPMDEWFQLTIVVEGSSVLIYLNGKMENSVVLNQYAPTDLGDKNLYVGYDKNMNFDTTSSSCPSPCTNADTSTNANRKYGFSGFIANMVYFPYSLTTREVEHCYQIYKKSIDEYQDKIQKKKQILG